MSHSGIAELFRAYHSQLLRLATRLVGDRGTGEDVVQDTFLRMVGGRVELAAISSPRHYLLVATRNIAFDARARAKREWARRVDLAELDNVLDHNSDPAVIFGHRDQLRRLADALNELPEDCRTAFFLNRVQGLRHREIAESLGMTVGRVERQLTRALLHCHTRLGPAENFF